MTSHFDPATTRTCACPGIAAVDPAVIHDLGSAMSQFYPGVPSDVPAGYTFVLQFLFHDLTWREPNVLQLHPLYGDDDSPGSYRRDGRTLRLGPTTGRADSGDPVLRRALPDFDLPRGAATTTVGVRRKATVPDPRSDENVGLAQTQVAMARFHNMLTNETRSEVVRHYQWMIRTDVLPRVICADVLDEVFSADPAVSLSVLSAEGAAAFRFVHSMIRGDHLWNRLFSERSAGHGRNLSLADLVIPGPEATLPTFLVPDQRLLYPLDSDVTPGVAQRIDTLVLDPYMPSGTTSVRKCFSLTAADLSFGNHLPLPSGPELAAAMGVPTLTDEQILVGDRGTDVTHVLYESRGTGVPLLFYVLREAEVHGGRLGPVGGRIIAREIRDAMLRSTPSILREPDWRPSLGHDGMFGMVELLRIAFENKPELLNPLGDGPR